MHVSHQKQNEMRTNKRQQNDRRNHDAMRNDRTGPDAAEQDGGGEREIKTENRKQNRLGFSGTAVNLGLGREGSWLA